ncbi:MAG: ribokinase [Actinomycetota bacterium]
MTMRVPSLPRPGETVSGGVLSSGPGGKGSNQAIGMARLGAGVDLLTAIGPDAAGADAVALWDAEGVGHASVKTGTAPTMTGFILVDSAGENSIAIAPGALDELTLDDARAFAPVIADADLLVVSMEIPAPFATELVSLARAKGVRTLLNPAPAGSVPAALWRGVDILTPNRGEAATLLGRDLEPAHLAEALAAESGALVVLTLGGDGVIVHDGSTATAVTAPAPPTIVDTTGAGDSFTAALAVALCAGLDPVAAARWAAAAGSHAVAYREVIPALPRLGDLPPLPDRNTQDR